MKTFNDLSKNINEGGFRPKRNKSLVTDFASTRPRVLKSSKPQTYSFKEASKFFQTNPKNVFWAPLKDGNYWLNDETGELVLAKEKAKPANATLYKEETLDEMKFAKNLPKAPGQSGKIKRLKIMTPELDNFNRNRTNFLTDLIGKKAGLQFKGSKEVMANISVFIKNARIKKSFIEFSYDDGYIDASEAKKITNAVSLTKKNIVKWALEVDTNKVDKKEMVMMNKVAKYMWNAQDDMSMREIDAMLAPASKVTGISVRELGRIGEDGPDMTGYEDDPDLMPLYTNIFKIAKALKIK